MTGRGCLLSAAILLVAVALVLGLFVLGAGHFLTSADPVPQADAIFVLGGESGAYHRTQHAVELFEQGYAPLVVFSGGEMRDFGVACSSAQFSVEAAQGLGLPAEAFLVSDEAQSTYDEAVNLAGLAAEQGWRSVIVVTDAFHTRRAARTFGTLAPGVAISVSVAPDPRFDPARWWATEDGLVTVPNELLKLGFYWVQYGISPF